MSFHSESQAGQLNAYFDATNSTFLPALDLTGMPLHEGNELRAALKPHVDAAEMNLLPGVMLKLHPDFNNQRQSVTNLWAIVNDTAEGPFLSLKQGIVVAKIASLVGVPQVQLVLDLPVESHPVRMAQRATRPAGRMRQWDALPANLLRAMA